MTPHMTGRAEPDAGGDQLDPSDLLSDDGTVDHSAVASISNSTSDLDPAEVSEIRRRLVDGASMAELADEFDRHWKTIRKHAKADQNYANNETPEMPPVENTWRVVDGE